MKAVTLGKDGVEIKELPEPKPQNQQILVKVKSCGLNRSDLLETQGQSFGHTGGNTKMIDGEFAGEIIELDEGPKMMSTVVGIEPDKVEVGDKVKARIVELKGESNIIFDLIKD